ncbi:MAG: hypothetical protein H6734_14885 [Alphaproteobacteria bacterium]|nr:hypothetical protein [Alphaproteobacteria bacterium]
MALARNVYGVFLPTRGLTAPLPDTPLDVAAADLDGDDLLDLVVGTGSGAHLAWGTGPGAFSAWQALGSQPVSRVRLGADVLLATEAGLLRVDGLPGSPTLTALTAVPTTDVAERGDDLLVAGPDGVTLLAWNGAGFDAPRRARPRARAKDLQTFAGTPDLAVVAGTSRLVGGRGARRGQLFTPDAPWGLGIPASRWSGRTAEHDGLALVGSDRGLFLAGPDLAERRISARRALGMPVTADFDGDGDADALAMDALSGPTVLYDPAQTPRTVLRARRATRSPSPPARGSRARSRPSP